MKGRYIVFADDDADDLELITGYFKHYNREVTVLEFKDGKEVMKFLDDFAINANAPLLVVLDINMPRMNGKDALIAIRKHAAFKHIPVIIYTTSANQEEEEFCQKYNASWVHKPNTMDNVKAIAKIIAEFCQQTA